MQVRMIVATGLNNEIGVVIGGKHEIPWHNKADFAHFKSLTMNHCVIMGSNTVYSLPKKLVGRIVIGVSRFERSVENVNGNIVFWVNSIESAIEVAKELKPGVDVYIAGGAQIYEDALNKGLVDVIDLSAIGVKCDNLYDKVIYLNVDWSQWKLFTEVDCTSQSDSFVYRVYQKKDESNGQAVISGRAER